MLKFFVIGTALIMVVGGIVYFLQSKARVATPAVESTAQASLQAATSTYATTTFSVVYPANFSVDSNFANNEVSNKKLIGGVKFSIPDTMATGTNLAAETFVSVEQLPRAKICSGDIYLKDNVKSTTVKDGGVNYSFATTSQAAVGATYDEYVYALVGSNPCTAVRYYILTSDMGTYSPGEAKPYDAAALMKIFDDIRHSLVLISQTSAPSTAHSQR